MPEVVGPVLQRQLEVFLGQRSGLARAGRRPINMKRFVQNSGCFTYRL